MLHYKEGLRPTLWGTLGILDFILLYLKFILIGPRGLSAGAIFFSLYLILLNPFVFLILIPNL